MPRSRKERRAYARRYYAEHSEKVRQYQAKHREEILARQRRYRAEHPEKARQYHVEHRQKINARHRRWYAEHREERLAYNRRYRAEHREEIRARGRLYDATHPKEKRNSHLKRHYGITLSEWNRIFEHQGKRCAICRSVQPSGTGHWATDHKANTKTVRGILCNPCNTALGLLREDERTMQRMLGYVRKYDSSRIRTKPRSFIGLA